MPEERRPAPDAARLAEIRRLLAIVPEVVKGTWAWNEEAAGQLALLPGAVAWLLAERERQAAENARLQRALLRYGQHDPECMSQRWRVDHGFCGCGLLEALGKVSESILQSLDTDTRVHLLEDALGLPAAAGAREGEAEERL